MSVREVVIIVRCDNVVLSGGDEGSKGRVTASERRSSTSD